MVFLGHHPPLEMVAISRGGWPASENVFLEVGVGMTRALQIVPRKKKSQLFHMM
jgi:hypothetical protein